MNHPKLKSSSSDTNQTLAVSAAPANNFLRHIIEQDLNKNTYAARRWAGKPGVHTWQSTGEPDPAKIRTRFPPEPNGYLHIGHAKSICLNFGLARDYGGICHMRFDDTNPVKEDQEYVDSILDAVQWLGFSWHANHTDHLYYASDYFEYLYQFAERLILTGHAYIDRQTAEEIRLHRGTLTEPGQDSPHRNTPAGQNLALFREMRAGKHPEGSMVLRARINMQAPNLNLRDPVIYRIRFAEHHRTGKQWCIYPMYDYAHPISDALECITHSICTLEFEDHRPFYDWLLLRLSEQTTAPTSANPSNPQPVEHLLSEPPFSAPLPKQYEFARLNLTYVVTSKRKLMQLVQEKYVEGWDDPRMPTIVGLRRRGYTPESLQLFCERIGVSKSDSWIDCSVLEQSLRDDLEPKAIRGIAVLRPLKLILNNYPEGQAELCTAPKHPQKPDMGQRNFYLTRELWIEQEDFCAAPPKGYFRLFPDNLVRLRYGYVVRCTGFKQNEAGEVIEVYADYLPDTKSSTAGADSVKVKGNIHWLSATDALKAEVRLYDRLFKDPHPDAGGKDFLQALNPQSKEILSAYVEPSLQDLATGQQVQFERHGYFVADSKDSQAHELVFNRITTLKDSWNKPIYTLRT